MERSIIHLDLDSFFVSVERLRNVSLVGKPVIIGGQSSRGVVASCSYEARRYGVHAAMPAKVARRLCPEASFIRGDMDAYTRYSRLVTDVIADSAPLYEKASIDEHYLDVTGMDHYIGTQKWAHELRQRITRETGLPISMGVSRNKTVSKIATGEAKPNGERDIPPPATLPFLAPLPVRKIPMVGEKTYAVLNTMGMGRIATLQAAPPELLRQVMGKNGILVWKKAHGIDPSPVEPYRERKSVGKERTFSRDTGNRQQLEALLGGMVEQLCLKLRNEQWLASVVTVKIRYTNFDTHSLQQRVPYTAFDHHLQPVAQNLFRRLYTRRMLLRLVGVKFSGLVRGTQQLDLFGDSAASVRLYQAMDTLRNRFGPTVLRHASTLWPADTKHKTQVLPYTKPQNPVPMQ